MAKNKKDKSTDNDVQNTMKNTKDQTTRTSLNTKGELKWSKRVSSSCSTSDTRWKKFLI
jgi:hypothetical protein